METVGLRRLLRRPRSSPPSAARRCCRSPAAGAGRRGAWLSAPTSSSSAPGSAGSPSAIRLAAAGRRVVVLERNDVTGGKLAAVRHGGATFDAGPSLLTLPHVLRRAVPRRRHVARRRGRPAPPRPAVPLPLARRLVARRARRPRRARSPRSTRFSPGAGAAWRRFDDHGRRIWDVSERTFLAGPMAGPLALLRRMRSPRDLLAIDPLRTLHRPGRGDVRRSPPRAVGRSLRHLLRVVAVPGAGDAGVHPARRGALRLLVPRGGLDALRAALERVADARRRRRPHGRRGRADRRRRRGGRPASARRRRRVGAPVVVANADAEHVYARPAARRPGAAPGPAGAALDERASSSWRTCAGRRPASATTTCGSPATTAPSSPPSRPADGRRPDDLRLRLGGDRPDPGAARHRELVPPRQHAARDPPRPGRRAPPDPRRARRRGASTCATASSGATRSRRCSSRREPVRRPGRSTARRRTAGGRRSCARQPRARGAACTSSAARATPAAGCRSWRRARRSSPG